VKLEHCLGCYDRDALLLAGSGWCSLLPTRPAGDVLRWIGDGKLLQQVVAALPPDALRALQVAHRLGRTEMLSLVTELAICGVHRAQGAAAVLTLHRMLLLLPDDPTSQYIRESGVRVSSIRLRLLDGLAEVLSEVADLPLPAASLPEVEPGLEVPVRRGDCAGMAVAMLELQRLAAIKPLKVTLAGWLAKTHTGTLAKALSAHHVSASGLVELAVRAGLLNQALQPGPRRLRFEEPMYPLALELLWIAALHARGDGCSLGGQDQEQELTWSTMSLRRVLLGLLKRLPTDCWMGVSALMDEVCALLFDIVPSRKASLQDAQTRYEAHNALLPLIGSLLPALGVLDIAGPEPHRPPEAWRLTSRRELGDPDLSFRITPFGSDLLSRAPATDPVATPALQISGMELIAPTRPNSELLYRLAWIADPKPRAPREAVQRFTLSRARWSDANQAGTDMAAAAAWLAKCTGRPLPAPVLQQIKGWSSLFGQLRVFLGYSLLRRDSAAARDLIAPHLPGGVRVGDTDLLIPKTVQLQGRILLVDYAADPPMLQAPDTVRWTPPLSVTLSEDLTITVDPDRADLHFTHLLSRITAPAPAGRRLDAAAIRQSGYPPEDIQRWIVTRLCRLPPPAAQLWLHSNLTGEAGDESVHLHTPELLISTDTIVGLLLQIPAARELFIGALAPDVLVLRPGARAELDRLLARLGVPSGTGLPILPLDAFAYTGEA